MMTKQIAALLRDDLTTVNVVFLREVRDEEDLRLRPNKPTTPPIIRRREVKESEPYTFKVLKEDAQHIVEGDYCVVDTAAGLRVAKVVEVHNEPQIDPDSDIDYRWFVAKIDVLRHHAILDHERALEKQVLQAERTVKRKSMIEQFREALGGAALSTTFDSSKALAAPAPVPPATGFRDE